MPVLFQTHEPRAPFEPAAPALRGTLAVASACFVVALVLVFSISIQRKVDVDEHPFIATAALMNRGFLPYRDYHYNHMPTQVMVYAALFHLTGHLLLVARFFQALCAAGLIALIGAIAYRSSQYLSSRGKILFAGGAALALVCHPLFTRTSGLSWNHDFPTFACIAGFVAMAHGVRSRRATAWALASGILLGIAVTSRLTFAPVTLALVLIPVLHPGLTPGRRIMLVLALGAGMIVASAPALWVCAQSPRNAYFGNFLYPKLNTEFHSVFDRHGRFTVVKIALYYLQLWVTLPGNGVLMVAFLLLMATTLKLRQVRTERLDCLLFVIVVAVACLTFAGFMPAPPFPQYFYAPVPFVMLAVVLCLAARKRLAEERLVHRALSVGLLITVGFAVWPYRGLLRLGAVSRWTPMQAHATGVDVARATPPGKILTLELVYPLEGGREVYEQLATTRFGLRTAQFLSAQERQQYRMPLPSQLDDYFVTDPPQAILIYAGVDPGLERDLKADAAEHGYRQTTRTRGEMLWLPPQRR